MFKVFLRFVYSYPMLSRLSLVFLLMGMLGYWFQREHISDSSYLYEGHLQVEGLAEKVFINRSNFGVPTIEASNDMDVYFAMGFVHAQDRLWQLEMSRRMSQGRLSEVLGKEAVDVDIWSRTLDLYNLAAKSKSYLSEEVLQSLQAYADGINAWLAHSPSLPVEFIAMGVRPEPWRVEDSLAWSKFFALSLSGNFRNEIRRSILAQYLDKPGLDLLFPEYVNADYNSEGYADLGSSAAGLFESYAKLDQVLNFEQSRAGSNAWVVSGKLTDSGFPILANDPHTSLQIPSIWYAVEQNGKQFKASGMTLVGMPHIVSGRNEHIAWGVTNMMADVQDLYVENVNPFNPNQYSYGDEWREFEVRTEYINVKADFPSALRSELAPVKIIVRKSVHGPIISDVIDGVGQPLALRWTGLNEEDSSYEFFYRLSYAENWAQFKKALRFNVAPVLNVLYSDAKGNIGFWGAGKIPLRAQGDGTFPSPGHDPSYDWKGYIPASQMPGVFNPDENYVISANDRNVTAEYPYFISYDWADPARAKRIVNMIKSLVASNGRVAAEDMISIQKDNIDLSVKPLLDYLIGVDVDQYESRQAIAELKAWSGDYSNDSVGSTVFYTWLRHLRKELFADELKVFINRDAEGSFLRSSFEGVPKESILKTLEEELEWCDNLNTSAVESCQEVLENSLSKSLEEMKKYVGRDISGWNWGRVHKAFYPHLPFSELKVVDRLFERSESTGGTENSVNASGAVFSESEGYQKVFGAGFRQVIGFRSDGVDHMFVNSTGQSGQFQSRHYDDMLKAFHRFEYLHMGNDSSRKNAESVLTLYPN